MIKRSIGCDSDDVIIECFDPLRVWHNDMYGTAHRYEDIKNFDLSHSWGGTLEQVVEKASQFLRSKYHDESQPVPGARAGLLSLGEQFNIHVVSARPLWARNLTREVYKKHHIDIN